MTATGPHSLDSAGASPISTSVTHGFRWTRRDLAIVLAATLLSHLYIGFHYGLSAHAVQLVRVLRLNDPSLYPGDLFVDSLDQYCSWFWVVVAWLARFANLSWILVASHVVSRCLLLAALFELAARMFPDRPVRYIALALATFRLRPILAGEHLLTALPTHTTFAFPLLMWGLLLAWRGRAISAALLLGLGCNCNLMTGLPATFVAAAGFAAGDRRHLLRSALLGAAVWLVVSTPVLRWAAATPAPDIDPTAYYYTIRNLFWWHFDPLRWGLKIDLRWLGLLLTLAVGLIATRRARFNRPMIASLIAIAVTWMAAIIASRLPTLGALMRFQLGRTAALAVAISVPLVAGAIWQGWSRRGARGVLVFVAIALGWSLSQGGTVTILLVSLAIVVDLRSGRSWLTAAIGRRIRRLAPVAGITVALVILQGFVRSYVTGDRSGILPRSAPAPWRDVQTWACAHTPRTATFVAPIHVGGFRVFSHRPMWLEFDFDAMLWHPDLTGEIQRRWARLRRTGLTDFPLERIDWAELHALAREEGVDYAVVPLSTLADRQPVYQNTDWAVVELENRPTPPGNRHNAGGCFDARELMGDVDIPPALTRRKRTGETPMLPVN